MMEPITLLTTGAQVISLTERLVTMIEDAREKENPPSLIEILISLRSAAITYSRDFTHQIRRVKAELERSEIDINKSISELYTNTKWFNFISRNKLKEFEKKFNSIYLELSVFLDDASAVLICAQLSKRLENPLLQGYETKKKLDDLINSNESISKICDGLLLEAENILLRLLGDDPNSTMTGGSNFPQNLNPVAS